MLPLARNRFGAQPVVIIEGLGRHVLATRASRSETDPVFVPPRAAVTEEVRQPPIAGRKQAGASRHPRLSKGVVFVLAGVMTEPRDHLEQRLTAAGFVIESTVTKRTALLVAADLDSLSGKARKARSYGIPIVGEEVVAALTRRA